MKLQATMKIFSLIFGAIYLACFYYGWSPFMYYPLVTEFHLAAQPASAGPPILWYGWLSTAAVISVAIALLVPVRVTERLWDGWYWIAPAATLAVILVYERRWFL
jgi:hypothetical protein